MRGDGLAQRKHAARRRFFHEGLAFLGDDFAQELFPGGKGKLGGVGLVEGKIKAVVLAWLRQGDVPAFFHRNMAHGRFEFCDVVAALWQGINVAFADELGVGAFDGDGADAEIFRQSAFAWQLFASSECSALDVVADHFVERFVKLAFFYGCKIVRKHWQCSLRI